MATLLWILLASYLVVVLLWVWGVLWVRGLHTDEEMQLHPLPDAPTDPVAPSLEVYIAAHNEQDRIGPCLEQLCRQNYPNLRVTVVNDRSADRTADCVREFMAQDARVRLVEVADLPEGCIGKSHALAVATANAKAGYLLFMDCDCRLAAGAVAAVMRKVVAERLEFLSLWPRLELLSSSERLLTPPACWVLGIWVFLEAKRGSRNSVGRLGNGQFMLFSRATYEKVGGHASVQAELAEDIILAGRVAALGLPRWAGLGKGLYVTTRTNTFAGTVNALTRVLVGSLVAPWRIMSSTQLLFGGVVMPAWLLPLSAYLAAVHGGLVWWAFAAASAVHLVCMFYLLRRMFAMTFDCRPSVPSFLLGSLLLIGLLFWAWLVAKGWGYVRWGRTAYRVQGSRVLRAIPEPRQSTAA